MIWRDHVFNFGPKSATRMTKVRAKFGEALAERFFFEEGYISKKEEVLSSIKHDLARSCFQFWLKIGDEWDKILREKNWQGASRDSFFSKFCHPRR